MSYRTVQPKFINSISDEKMDKVSKSLKEAESLNFRPVYCYNCENHLFDVGEDIVGHIAVKCQHCKSVVPINAAYFHRSDIMAIMRRKLQIS